MGLSRVQISKYQHIMNCAAWLVSGIGKFDHVTPVMKCLHWLPAEARTHYKILCLTIKAMNDINHYVPVQALHSSEKGLLVVPKVKTKIYGGRAFAHAGPYLFNTLPEEIHLSPSYNTFKANLKMHLFQTAYDT